MKSIPRLVMSDGYGSGAPEVNIVSTNGSHIAVLKNNLRRQDADEILRFGVSIKHALWRSYRTSVVRKTALIDGVVAACWGVNGMLMGNIGQPWLMTTPEVKRISPLKFVRIYQEEVIQMLKMFPKLENFCDAEYDSAIRLLEIIGFNIGEPQAIGNGMYRKFWIGA